MALFDDILNALGAAAGIAAGVNQITTRPTTTVTTSPPLAPSPFEIRQNQLAEAIALANLNKAGYNARFSPTGELSLTERALTPEEQLNKTLRSSVQQRILQQIGSTPSALERQGQELAGMQNARLMASMGGGQGLNRAGLINAIRSRMSPQRGLGLGNIGTPTTTGTGFSTTVPATGFSPTGGGTRTTTASDSGTGGFLGNIGNIAAGLGAGKTIWDLINKSSGGGTTGGGSISETGGTAPSLPPSQIPNLSPGLSASIQDFLNLFSPTSTGGIAPSLSLGEGFGSIPNPYFSGGFSIDPSFTGVTPGLNPGQFNLGEPGLNLGGIGGTPPVTMPMGEFADPVLEGLGLSSFLPAGLGVFGLGAGAIGGLVGLLRSLFPSGEAEKHAGYLKQNIGELTNLLQSGDIAGFLNVAGKPSINPELIPFEPKHRQALEAALAGQLTPERVKEIYGPKVYVPEVVTLMENGSYNPIAWGAMLRGGGFPGATDFWDSLRYGVVGNVPGYPDYEAPYARDSSDSGE